LTRADLEAMLREFDIVECYSEPASSVDEDLHQMRRNAVLHGHDVAYGQAKFSVQALLIVAILAEGVAELESGEKIG
jgi:hypothetical protein